MSPYKIIGSATEGFQENMMCANIIFSRICLVVFCEVGLKGRVWIEPIQELLAILQAKDDKALKQSRNHEQGKEDDSHGEESQHHAMIGYV